MNARLRILENQTITDADGSHAIRFLEQNAQLCKTLLAIFGA